MRWFVAALLRQSTCLVSWRGKSGEKEKEIYVKEFLTDAHIARIMSQDLKAIYRRLKYLLSSPRAVPSSPHFCGAFTPPSRPWFCLRTRCNLPAFELLYAWRINFLAAETDGNRGRLCLKQRTSETVHCQKPSTVFRMFCSAEYDMNRMTILDERVGTRGVVAWAYFETHRPGISF
jgi:hypothetical protein